MNYFTWRDRNPNDLKLFARHAEMELRLRISGFPPFVVVRSSDRPKRRVACKDWHMAAAHTTEYASFHLIYTRPRRPHVWTVEFNDHYPDLYDMEMVLYHELAHFMSRRSGFEAPSHGLLWAACCDALMLVMEMDADSRDEGTEYIFDLDWNERTTTFAREHIIGAEHWRQVRARTHAVLVGLLEQMGRPIRFDDLMAVIQAAHLRCRPTPPPPKPKRRRKQLAAAA
jgi:hypothetical protein